MPQISPVSWLFALSTLVALPVVAQVQAPPAAPAPTNATALTAPAAAASLPYRSVFEGYQPFTDERVMPWKDTNAAVEKIGGWRAYAKEAAEPAVNAPPTVSPDPAPSPSPAPPTSAAPPANPHAGHGKH